MANDLQLNLGTLRSSVQLTLHTHHASRIWHGRDASQGRATIIGLNGFIAVMNKMKRGAELDDPYADAWMLRIEDKLNATKDILNVLNEQVNLALAEVPSALSLGENLNVQPVKLPLFVNAQLGFMAVYLLADYDDLARRLILAHHTALIDRSSLERWLNEGAHALRSLFSLAQQYKSSGLNREDYQANTSLAISAKERFGEIDQDILEGTRRSRFAPPLVRRLTISAPQRDEENTLDVAIDSEAHSPHEPVSSAREQPAEDER
ncbi:MULTISPECIES: PFL_4669 family integrating conjugative element protein [unclassified Pseudomonas]|uniref:PFL_4669 family integrating conjugative element protein n=1 Tax=unclassified Pseudomonas TaxID=196821 RepID=UPI0008763D76|nr:MULTISPECIES: TIGR03761 family integrating conjugative element protein [unclassified Pseudomonas]SCZ39991.1 integrating conjugative element protein, PFL_4669 family [Pseudomonas sp. NFACC44-2]SDA89852.1 integrating conjugative element protein, PFL_4669 family [Pseudomonas sp. NFACC51]SDW42311.1 integrating conjugative element protein, PFL_4669 family [Pseudomonas sp. NFACC08-1]SFI16951.1 integrating conjugative element protein, PFL_4669 family [Pseudomonas sp. NFACC54]SFT28449.1 integrating